MSLQLSSQLLHLSLRGITCGATTRWLSTQQPTVYKGQITPRIRRTRIISLTSSAATTIFAPLIAAKKLHLTTIWFAVACGTPMTLTYMYTAVVFFMTRTYVTEMFLKNPDTLIIKKYNFFCKQVSQEVDPKEIEVPVNVGLLESFRVKGESFMIDDNAITDRDLYECVSGFRHKKESET